MIGLIDGIVLQNPDPITYVWLALIFTFLNAILKPILKFGLGIYHLNNRF